MDRDDPVYDAEGAAKAAANQFAMMCYERWQAEVRIRALKAEIQRRSEAAR